MKKLIALLLLLTLAIVSPSYAKGKKKPAGEEGRIVEVTALSITLSLGKTGDDHVTYNITKDTVVKFDGATATADNLRAGMVARVEAVKDHSDTAKEIDAHDPPKH